jgi:CheY-like chemotaxis protein
MKILVVDDVGYARHFHVRLLQKFGYDVQSAETGPQALRMLERDMTIDVVLTDLMMRDMDGVELYKNAMRISRMVDGGQANPPVFLLMTALRPGTNSQQKDVEKLRMAKEIGFAEVLYKPIEPDALRKTLESVKFARGKEVVDVAGYISRVEEAVNRIIATQDATAAEQYLQALYDNQAKLEAAQMQFAK